MAHWAFLVAVKPCGVILRPIRDRRVIEVRANLIEHFIEDAVHIEVEILPGCGKLILVGRDCCVIGRHGFTASAASTIPNPIASRKQVSRFVMISSISIHSIAWGLKDVKGLDRFIFLWHDWPMREHKPEVKFLHVRIEPDLMHQAKVAAAQQGKLLHELVSIALSVYLKKK